MFAQWPSASPDEDTFARPSSKTSAGEHVELQVVAPPGIGREQKSWVIPGAMAAVVVQAAAATKPLKYSTVTEQVSRDWLFTEIAVALRKFAVVCEFM